jgi:hypothetical protein
MGSEGRPEAASGKPGNEAPEVDAETIVGKLVAQGVGEIFADPHFKETCIETLRREIGTTVPGAGIIAITVYKLVQTASCSAVGLIGDGAMARLYGFLNKVPGLRRIFALLTHFTDACRDRSQLKTELMQQLRLLHPGAKPPAADSSIETLHDLLTKAQLEGIQGEAEAIRQALRESYAGLAALIAAQADPVLDDKRGQQEAARAQIADGAQLPTLNYTAKVDDFLGREESRARLWDFVRNHGRAPATNRFGWLLMVADGGEGKSRLALQFMEKLQANGWRAGFLSPGELRRMVGQGNMLRWRPAEPTLFILDYPAEAPSEVAELILGLAKAGHQRDFDYPVRVLLLERRAAGKWFDGLVPTDSDRPLVEQCRWEEAFHLPPLGKETLLALMRARFAGGAAPDDTALWNALVTVDNRRDAQGQRAPRVLFAVATALFMAENPTAPVSREQVLEALLKRERAHFWHPESLACDDETDLRIVHENLLAVATMALSVERAVFDAMRSQAILSCGSFPRFKPGEPLRFDADRFQRMSGSDPQALLGSLQPDLLGEFFALSLLLERDSDERELLIEWSAAAIVPGDVAGETGFEGFVQFSARAFRDFPSLFDRNSGLLPENSRSPALILSHRLALWEVSANQGRGVDEADVDRLARYLLGRSWDKDQAPSEELDHVSAAALVNLGVSLGALDRPDEAIAAYDALDARLGASELPGVQEQVALALYNKGVTLGALEAIAAYDALDERFGASELPGVQEHVAAALYNKGVTLGALDRPDEAIAAYDALDERFGTSEVPAVQEQVAMALVNKGATLGALEAIAAYDALDERFGASKLPGVQKQVAAALYNKGVTLRVLDRPVEAIAAYDALDARLGASELPGVQEQVALALFNKGVTLDALDRPVEAIAAYDALDARLGASELPGVQEQVGAAMVNKGAVMATNGHLEDAERVAREIIARYDHLAGSFAQDVSARARQLLDLLDDAVQTGVGSVENGDR